jgi:hypothetical protein
MNADPERYIAYQFWLVDHDGNRILFSEWSDGEIDEADLMLPDRIIDLQIWNAQSGEFLNHLCDVGWLPGGQVPLGIGIPDNDPIAELPSKPDHESLPPAALAPTGLTQKEEPPKTPPEPFEPPACCVPGAFHTASQGR